MLCVDVLEKTRGSVVIIVKPDDDDIQKSAEPIDVRSILGISERTRDVSIPFWAAIGGWLEDGVRFRYPSNAKCWYADARCH